MGWLSTGLAVHWVGCPPTFSSKFEGLYWAGCPLPPPARAASTSCAATPETFSPSKYQDAPDAKPLAVGSAAVAFERCTFEYTPGTSVLKVCSGAGWASRGRPRNPLRPARSAQQMVENSCIRPGPQVNWSAGERSTAITRVCGDDRDGTLCRGWTSRRAGAARWRLSERPAAASPPACGCSSGSTTRHRGASPLTGKTSAASHRRAPQHCCDAPSGSGSAAAWHR